MLADFHAMTLAAEKDGHPCVLRITHRDHRTRAQIEAELEWIRDLGANGVHAPQPIQSLGGNWTEQLPDPKGPLTAVAFCALRGRSVTAEDYGPALFREWGALVGRLHQRSAAQRPRLDRQSWDQSDFLNVEEYLPPDETIVRTVAADLIGKIQGREFDPKYYGLIHADVYQDNFRLLPDGHLELFDFDNAEYGWFVSDVANALYAALWWITDVSARLEFAQAFLRDFLIGYRRHYDLPDSELAWLPVFFTLREILIYTVSHKQLDSAALTPGQQRMRGIRRQRLEAGTAAAVLGR